MDWMRTDVWKSSRGKWFGYKMFRPLFFENEKDNSLKLQYFLQFLPNMVEFVVMYQPSQKYLPSILVNSSFVKSFVGIALFINTHKTLSSSIRVEQRRTRHDWDPLQSFYPSCDRICTSNVSV